MLSVVPRTICINLTLEIPIVHYNLFCTYKYTICDIARLMNKSCKYCV